MQADAHQSSVQLMTMAKGLEFPLVMLAGMEQSFSHQIGRKMPRKIVWKKSVVCVM